MSKSRWSSMTEEQRAQHTTREREARSRRRQTRTPEQDARLSAQRKKLGFDGNPVLKLLLWMHRM